MEDAPESLSDKWELLEQFLDEQPGQPWMDWHQTFIEVTNLWGQKAALDWWRKVSGGMCDGR